MSSVLKTATQVVQSVLGVEAPKAPAVTDPATPAVKATPAAALTTGARARTRGARAASILTTDLGDSKLGG